MRILLKQRSLEGGDVAEVSRFNRIRKAAVPNSLIHPAPTLLPIYPYTSYLCAFHLLSSLTPPLVLVIPYEIQNL